VPTRLLLEGPDITELLARIRAEHGESARIVKAEKLRVGGFAGFFAKQRYEVMLEIADLVPGGPAAPAAPVAPVAPAAVTTTPATAPVTSVDLAASMGLATAPGSIEELAELADRADTAELAELGRRVPAASAAPIVAAGPPPARAPGRSVSTESDDFAAVLSRLTVGLGADGVDFDALPPAPLELPADFRPLYGSSVAPPARTPVTPPAAPTTPAEEPYEKLRALGVPAHLAAAVNGDDLHSDLVRVFKTLPTAPALPRRPGDVVVVMGDVASALPVGRALAKKLRLDPTRILLAAPSTAGTGVPAARRISGPADAERRARRMHRDDVPHVVVVDVPIDGESGEWAADIADALGASTVWAVVDATRKTGDLADHLERLGSVDALVVQRTDVTRDPAVVLDLRIPVALLDGRSATPRAWADLVSDRLDADETTGRDTRSRRRSRRS
jgi:hypothetical protein